MFCVRPRRILMGEKTVTRGVLEAMAKCQSPYLLGLTSNQSIYISIVR